MLERVLEQEVMDTLEDAEEYASVDNREVNDTFVAQALELAPRAGQVVDIGTGPAEIAILLAQRAPRLRVLGIDLGQHMLDTARRNVARAGLTDRVDIRRADAKATGLPDQSVDMVISNSLVHHIPEPMQLFTEVKRIARPNAALFIKDLHRPTTREEHAHLVELYTRGCTPYQIRGFSESLQAGLTVSEVSAFCEAAGLTEVSVRRCSDRHWCLERRVRPESTH
jgi:ubiquinone/menaquinone biosynthesis C-methylase UbiE